MLSSGHTFSFFSHSTPLALAEDAPTIAMAVTAMIEARPNILMSLI
jgi:hypothetical protein